MRSNLHRKLLFLVFAVAAGGGFAAFRARSEDAPKAAAPKNTAGPVLLAEAVTVRAQVLRRENVLSGQVEPLAVATVAAEAPGRLLARPVEEGDRVAKGALLASIDSDAAEAALEQAIAAHAQAVAARRQAESDYARAVVETDAARQQARAQVRLAAAGERKTRSFTRDQELRQAQAALSQAQTDERLAKIEADRYSQLVAQGAVAQQTLDRAQAALDAAAARRTSAEQAVSLAREGARTEDIAAASAQLQSARAGLRIAETRPARLAVLRRQIDGLRAGETQAVAAVRAARAQLRRHRVVSPLAGRILAAPAEAGETVAPGTPIVRIADIRRVKVAFAVPEASRAALRRGQAVNLSMDALPGRRFQGRITLLGFEAEARGRTFPVEITVPNANEALLPNMVARLRLPVGPAASRVLVPVAAVATDGAAPYVLILKNGKAARRDIALGAPQGESVEVARGLAAGERIAAAPQRLTDGAAVRIARAEGGAQ